MDGQIQYEVKSEESGDRIDALLARNFEGLSRNAAQRLTEQGAVTVNGSTPKKNYRCSPGDLIALTLPEAEEIPLVAQDIPLDIRYEDKDLVVVNKARGMVVHPAPGHPDGTLVNALLYHCGSELSGIGGEKRPGIVHRIDKYTSGLIIVAKNDAAHQFLSAQLSDHTLSREYYAVVHGSFREDTGTVNAPVGRHPVDRKRMAVPGTASREAITHWEVVTRFRGYTLLRCKLETGRTHQIRVHMQHIGHPLLGDGVYGAPCPEKGLEGQCLHAARLQFIHPATKELTVVECPLPGYFTDVLSKLGPAL